MSNFVVSAETTNTVKNRLDKFRSDQDVLFDYNADLHGNGNRSIIYLAIDVIIKSYINSYFSDIEAIEAYIRLHHVM